MALVVLNDADDHRCEVVADHRLAPGLGVQGGVVRAGPPRPVVRGGLAAGRTESLLAILMSHRTD